MSNISINNKKARFEYELLETFTAGMVLLGPEIKSIRMGKASIKEAYCYLKDNEVWIRNMHISPYEEATFANHEPLRERKLLLHDQEIKKISRKLRDVGVTIVALKVFISAKGWAKIEIAAARGRKLHDKRDNLKEKDLTRQIKREAKDL